MRQNNDIAKILNRSSIKEISEFIIDPEEKVADIFMVWIDEDGGLHLASTVNLMEALGLVVMAKDMLKERSWEEGDD